MNAIKFAACGFCRPYAEFSIQACGRPLVRAGSIQNAHLIRSCELGGGAIPLAGLRHDVLAGNEELLACELQLRLNLSVCVDDSRADAEFKSDSYKIVTGNGDWDVTIFRYTLCGTTQSSSGAVG